MSQIIIAASKYNLMKNIPQRAPWKGVCINPHKLKYFSLHANLEISIFLLVCGLKG